MGLDCGADWSGAVVMADDASISIKVLIATRDQLARRINSGEVDEYDPAYDPIMTKLEQIDWQIANTEAQTLVDLRLKFGRMADLVCPQGFGNADSDIQAALIKSLDDDLAQLT